MKNMKIGRRLGLGFGVMQLFILVLAVLAALRIETIQGNLDTLMADSNAKIIMANRMLDHSRNMALAVRDVIIMEEASDMAPVLEQLAMEKKLIRRTWRA